MRLVGTGIDRALAPMQGLLPEGTSTPTRDAYLAVVNGVHGDYLARTGDPLALDMVLRHRGRQVDPADPTSALTAAGFPAPTGKVLLLVHGLCMSDLQWTRKQHDHGEALARDLGYTPLYLRYNTGLNIADNGFGSRRCWRHCSKPGPYRSRTSRSSATAWVGWSQEARSTRPSNPGAHGPGSWGRWCFSARHTTAHCWSAAVMASTS